VTSFCNQQEEKSLEDFSEDSVLEESDEEFDHEIDEDTNKENDKEPNKENEREWKFSNVIVIDNDRSLVLDQHIVTPLDAFVAFLDSNFVLRNCGKSQSVIKYQIVGIASSINWFCVCKSGGPIKAQI
jgi:hypothetical protein